MPDLIPAKHIQTLKHLASDAPDEGIRKRARLLLLYGDGKATRDVAEAVGLSTSTVLRWRRTFAKDGMAIFPEDALARASEAAPAPADTPAAKPAEPTQPQVEAATAPDEGQPEGGEAPSWMSKRLARIGDALEEVLEDAERITHLKGITEARPLKKFVKELKGHRKKLKKRLKAKKLKKKVARKLAGQLKVLEKQIKRAEKVLEKMD